LTDPTRARVSVCIPTVDRPELLREAIASVAAQTWRDFEVVVADNSGDPALQKRIDEVLAGFPELRFVVKRHPRRVDAIDNFNSLIDTAQGELWACLTDDDRFRPNFLARSVEALDQHPECAFTFADHWMLRPDGTLDEPESEVNSIRFSRNLLREGVYRHDELFEIVLRQSVCLQTTLFRHPVIASFRFMPGIMSGDQSLFMRLSAGRTSHHAYYVDERLFEYRWHQDQLSNTTGRKALLRSQIAACESAPEIPRQHRRIFNRKLSRCYLALALLEAEDGDHRSARSHAAKSFLLDPNFRSTFGGLLAAAAPFAVKRVRALRGLLQPTSERRP
jgi:glycosyltransferase involved in cell wall biosynthesis